MDSPTALSTNTEMYSFVYNLIAKFEEAAFSPNFCTAEGQHWSEFVDIQSFIDFWLIFNFTKNIDKTTTISGLTNPAPFRVKYRAPI